RGASSTSVLSTAIISRASVSLNQSNGFASTLSSFAQVAANRSSGVAGTASALPSQSLPLISLIILRTYQRREAIYGHAGVWSLRYLGDPDRGDKAFRRCLKELRC